MNEFDVVVEDGVALPDDLVFDADDVAAVVEAMEKIHSSREAIKDIMANVKAQGLNSKIFRKVCKAEYEKNFVDVKTENTLFHKAYENLGR